MNRNHTPGGPPTRLHHRAGAAPPVAVRGEGAYIFDEEGRRYLDACGGAAVSCLGHDHPKVIAAVSQQLSRLAFGYSGFFTTEPLDRLAAHLTEMAPGPLSAAFFVSGGSEAMEAALKIARQHFVEIGQPGRRFFISRRQSYHGNTLGALAVSGHNERRALYEPMLMPVRKIAPCFAYRWMRPDETLAAYGLRAANELEEMILDHPEGSVAAFIAETVVGATTGAVTAAPGYFQRIREICDAHGVLLILDEVMCGLGRCGRMFAFEDEGVTPDIVTLAKGLGAGFQPIGAVIVADHVAASIRDGSGVLRHGHTYSGHTTACAAAYAVQEVFREENLVERVRVKGAVLETALRARLGDHPHVGDIRGRGLFWALEFVSDRAAKAPFPRSETVAERIHAAAMAEGLLVYPGAGCADGVEGDHVIIAPPFTITDAELKTIVSGVAAAVEAVCSER